MHGARAALPKMAWSRLILDGTAIKTRLDGKAAETSAMTAVGELRDGQKVLFSIRDMDGESKRPERGSAPISMVWPDAAGVRRRRSRCRTKSHSVALWGEELPIQHCAVHKFHNLLAHATKLTHEELAEKTAT